MTAVATQKFERRQEPEAANDDNVRRYFDVRYGMTIVKVLPGDHYVTSTPGEMLVTVLGSCVSACIRDPYAGVGGMNHFMLPQSDSGTWGNASESLRYGNFAMERLINDILKRGGRRERLEVKLFGGANLAGFQAAVGSQNADFAEEYLRTEGISIAASDLRGTLPRRIHYVPETGKAMVLALKRKSDELLLHGEERYRRSVIRKPSEGDVELFS